jgi:hypothetical protein
MASWSKAADPVAFGAMSLITKSMELDNSFLGGLCSEVREGQESRAVHVLDVEQVAPNDDAAAPPGHSIASHLGPRPGCCAALDHGHARPEDPARFVHFKQLESAPHPLPGLLGRTHIRVVGLPP